MILKARYKYCIKNRHLWKGWILSNLHGGLWDSKENIQIELKDGYLKITATRNINKEDTRVLRQERFTGTYSRSFYIGEGYKQEDIKARFDNGELFILLPTKPVKHEEETRYINIQ